MRHKILLVVLLAGCAKSDAKSADTLSVIDQFAGPESMQYYGAADQYFVSNVNGYMWVKDDNGFISRVSPDGKVIDLKWIDGAALAVTLHAPKGLAIRHDTLFVADIDTIRTFDIATGSPTGDIAVPGARFLNGLAVSPDGVLYATDSGLKADLIPTGSDAVWRIDASGPVQVARGTWLNRPNGIKVGPEGATVVTFGSKQVLRLRSPTEPAETLATVIQGTLDGLVRLDSTKFVVTSWDGQALYLIDDVAKRTRPLFQHMAGPADIGYDNKRHRLLIPLVSQNRLEIRKAP